MESLMLASYHFQKLLEGRTPPTVAQGMESWEPARPLGTLARVLLAFAVPAAFGCIAAFLAP